MAEITPQPIDYDIFLCELPKHWKNIIIATPIHSKDVGVRQAVADKLECMAKNGLKGVALEIPKLPYQPAYDQFNEKKIDIEGLGRLYDEMESKANGGKVTQVITKWVVGKDHEAGIEETRNLFTTAQANTIGIYAIDQEPDMSRFPDAQERMDEITEVYRTGTAEQKSAVNIKHQEFIQQLSKTRREVNPILAERIHALPGPVAVLFGHGHVKKTVDINELLENYNPDAHDTVVVAFAPNDSETNAPFLKEADVPEYAINLKGRKVEMLQLPKLAAIPVSEAKDMEPCNIPGVGYQRQGCEVHATR